MAWLVIGGGIVILLLRYYCFKQLVVSLVDGADECLYLFVALAELVLVARIQKSKVLTSILHRFIQVC